LRRGVSGNGMRGLGGGIEMKEKFNTREE